MSNATAFSGSSDQQLLLKIKESADHLSVIYKKCRSSCIAFMRSMTSGSASAMDLEDIFQDAVIILYEKIVDGNFELTASFQTYLNSVCRYQLLNRLKSNSKSESWVENQLDTDENGNKLYDQSIQDDLFVDQIENEDLFHALEDSLLTLKDSGGHCYELLTLFWYHKKSMTELTEIFGYTNANNTKNQKAKCQKRLEKLAQSALQNRT